jgi:hypothetical protein
LALADGLELMFVGIGFICIPIAIVAYSRINKKREALGKDEVNKYTPQEIRELGDRSPDFRYSL